MVLGAQGRNMFCLIDDLYVSTHVKGFVAENIMLDLLQSTRDI